MEKIDVSRCKFYDGICKSPINKSDLECSLIPIERCYYKQLKRKEKECEELEKKLEIRKANDLESEDYWFNYVFDKDYPFIKENIMKELNDYYFVLEQLPKIYMEITGGTLSKTNYFAQGVLDAHNSYVGRLKDKIDKYEQALQEIKEIAQIACDKSICHHDCSVCSDGKILQIISEVENNVKNI